MLYVLGPLPNQSMSAFPFVLTAWAAANADLCLSSLSFLALLPMPIIDLFFIIKFSHTWPLDSLTMVGSIRPTHDIIDIAAMTLVLLGFSTSCMHDSCAPVHPVVTGPGLAHGQSKKMLMWKCLYNNYLAIFCIGIMQELQSLILKEMLIFYPSCCSLRGKYCCYLLALELHVVGIV